MKIIRIFLTSLLLSVLVTAQTASISYEVEISLPKGMGNRDTREVNAVIIFESENVYISSRRRAEIYKQFTYAEVLEVQHDYNRPGKRNISIGDIALTAATGIPFFLFKSKKERNWITIIGTNDFAVMKVENDNFRQILAEFAMRKVKTDSQDENEQRKTN